MTDLRPHGSRTATLFFGALGLVSLACSSSVRVTGSLCRGTDSNYIEVTIEVKIGYTGTTTGCTWSSGEIFITLLCERKCRT